MKNLNLFDLLESNNSGIKFEIKENDTSNKAMGSISKEWERDWMQCKLFFFYIKASAKTINSKCKKSIYWK